MKGFATLLGLLLAIALIVFIIAKVLQKRIELKQNQKVDVNKVQDNVTKFQKQLEEKQKQNVIGTQPY